ncbi:hypothetical protein K438DRAFT_2018237 [Mycena galopus ATCC 62051]|nr:hypothetical protein K438DRAFT_2018237 [Mycena galopus ATCC 62051]
MASCNSDTANAAIASLKAEVPSTQIEFFTFDLTSLRVAKAAAKVFLEREEHLDMLILNAGVMGKLYELTADRIKLQVCNGTGHFTFTVDLLPILQCTDALPDTHVRVISLSSKGHSLAQNPNFSDLKALNQKCITMLNQYNILFTNELQGHLTGTGIYCLSRLEPDAPTVALGTLASYLWLAPFTFFKKYTLLTSKRGVCIQLHTATALEVEEKDLKYASFQSDPSDPNPRVS